MYVYGFSDRYERNFIISPLLMELLIRGEVKLDGDGEKLTKMREIHTALTYQLGKSAEIKRLNVFRIFE